jgi:Cu(I)/Ag(I) efflux system membrane fusion protein
MPLKKLSDEEAEKLKGVSSRVKIDAGQLALAGVKSEPVTRRHLYKEIITVGKVAYDPELAIAQDEYISSLNSYDIMKSSSEEIKQRALNLVNSAKKKLLLLGLGNAQINSLAKSRRSSAGLILPGKKMWVYGDMYEYDLAWIEPGQKVEIKASALPGKLFEGTVSSINPTINPQTRALRFRAQVNNPDLLLKPEMYVDIAIKSMYKDSNDNHMVLAIPENALLDTGMRKIVWLEKTKGEYEGRTVETGPLSNTDGDERKFYPVLKGLKEGDKIVTKANFLIDSQSQLMGTAASAYGGALDGEDKKVPAGHQH